MWRCYPTICKLGLCTVLDSHRSRRWHASNTDLHLAFGAVL